MKFINNTGETLHLIDLKIGDIFINLEEEFTPYMLIENLDSNTGESYINLLTGYESYFSSSDIEIIRIDCNLVRIK